LLKFTKVSFFTFFDFTYNQRTLNCQTWRNYVLLYFSFICSTPHNLSVHALTLLSLHCVNECSTSNTAWLSAPR
jgi:hypothetical protein